MIKYDVKNYEAFFSSITMEIPVYMEKFIGNIPIPDLYGCIYPFFQNGTIKIALITIDENSHIKPKEFKQMIISRKLTRDTMTKIFNLSDALNIYNLFKDKYNLFVLDNTYNIENNN